MQNSTKAAWYTGIIFSILVIITGIIALLEVTDQVFPIALISLVCGFVLVSVFGIIKRYLDD